MELYITIAEPNKRTAAVGHTSHGSLYSECDTTDSVFLHLLHHLQHNDDKMLTLLSCQNNELFLQYFKTELKDMIHEQFYNNEATNKTNLPEDFLINHVSATFVETVTWWINHKLEDSPEQIADYFFSVLNGVVEFTSSKH